MACFTVPLATAVAAAVAEKAAPNPARLRKNPLFAKLGWLKSMMFGGSFLLAIEHVYHGEIVLTPPFLTAVRDGDAAGMLHEMATVGVAMAAVLLAAWAAMVAVSSWLERAGRRPAAQEG